MNARKIEAERLPSVLREHVAAVLKCEVEPHVIEDAIAIVQQAADALDAFTGEKCKIGDRTMERVFRRAGLANMSNMQAVLDAVEAAIVDADRNTFQKRVTPWLLACFGEEIAADREERNHRFLEEALELVQANGCTASEAHQLVDYVFGREVGEPMQEVGGVMVTLAALCRAIGIDMHAAGEIELARIWTKVDAIRAKQAAKPKHSPLAAAPRWRPEVEAFADLMEQRLRANDHKPGWKGDNPWGLARRVTDEAEMLERRAGSWCGGDGVTASEVGADAADVANMAMMVADTCGALGFGETNGSV